MVFGVFSLELINNFFVYTISIFILFFMFLGNIVSWSMGKFCNWFIFVCFIPYVRFVVRSFYNFRWIERRIWQWFCFLYKYNISFYQFIPFHKIQYLNTIGYLINNFIYPNAWSKNLHLKRDYTIHSKNFHKIALDKISTSVYKTISNLFSDLDRYRSQEGSAGGRAAKTTSYTVQTVSSLNVSRDMTRRPRQRPTGDLILETSRWATTKLTFPLNNIDQ